MSQRDRPIQADIGLEWAVIAEHDRSTTPLNEQRVEWATSLMPEHVHMLVSEPEVGLLAVVLQALKISFARRWTKHDPPVWQRRYYDHNVRNYESFVEKLRYIHRNPVTRGLVEKPEDWKWSSFRHYSMARWEWSRLNRGGPRNSGADESRRCYGFVTVKYSKDPHLPKAGRCGAPSNFSLVQRGRPPGSAGEAVEV